MNISFFVVGTPKPQPRPRAFARKLPSGKVIVRAYEAGTAEAWKAAIAEAVRPFVPSIPFDGPLRVDITFNMPRPKSHFKTQSAEARAANAPLLCKSGVPIWHVHKPDRDNLEKAVLDALSQIGIWRDDSQVCSGEVKKVYAIASSPGGAAIVIEELQDEALAVIK